MATVYIIGAGPGAHLGAAEAKLNHCDVIAGNYGAVATLDAGIFNGTWLVADYGVWEFDWAHRALIQLHQRGWKLGVSACTLPACPHLAWDFVFDQEPAAGYGDGTLMHGVLRCGGTVASQMVQLAWQRGYTDIVLCGCHLTGGEYFDGKMMYPDRGEWDCKPTFEAFCDSCRRDGINVVHFDCVSAVNHADSV